jgi:8-oxo-dGTP pyrophosphatase MutT (NUDIX family)
MKHKVLAYITRRREGGRQLLVFTHRDYPEAGVQVPAGTVERGEEVEHALFREVREETGLVGLKLTRKLAEHREMPWKQIRHVFHLAAPSNAPDRWTHVVQGRGEDAGVVFECAWVTLDADVELAGNQHQWLEALGGDGQ